MPIWFYAPDFRFSSTPSILDPRIVPAYHATFQKTGTPGASLKLCMLHDDDLAAFPYHGPLAEAFAVFFAIQNGLELIGVPSYGFVSRDDTWIRFRCCRPQWQG